MVRVAVISLSLSLWQNNEEGGNETKMKRWTGGGEVCLLSGGNMHQAKAKRTREERLGGKAGRLFNRACEPKERERRYGNVSVRGVGNLRLRAFSLCVT